MKLNIEIDDDADLDSNLELVIGIIATSVPTLKSLFDRLLRSAGMQLSSNRTGADENSRTKGQSVNMSTVSSNVKSPLPTYLSPNPEKISTTVTSLRRWSMSDKGAILVDESVSWESTDKK